jgi:hypothetical protein
MFEDPQSRDVHETFQSETEIETETLSPETETFGTDTETEMLAKLSETRPWVGLETVSRRRDRDALTETTSVGKKLSGDSEGQQCQTLH